MSAGEGAVRKPLRAENLRNAAEAGEAQSSQQPAPAVKPPETKQGKEKEASRIEKLSTRGVRAWQSRTTQKQRGRKNAAPENARAGKAKQQKAPTATEGKKKAKEETPKYDILDSPPEKLRSGMSSNAARSLCENHNFSM